MRGPTTALSPGGWAGKWSRHWPGERGRGGRGGHLGKGTEGTRAPTGCARCARVIPKRSSQQPEASVRFRRTRRVDVRSDLSSGGQDCGGPGTCPSQAGGEERQEWRPWAQTPVFSEWAWEEASCPGAACSPGFLGAKRTSRSRRGEASLGIRVLEAGGGASKSTSC